MHGHACICTRGLAHATAQLVLDLFQLIVSVCFIPLFFPFRILTSFLNIRDPLTLDRPQYTQPSAGKSGRDGLKKVEKKNRTRGKKKEERKTLLFDTVKH